LSEKQLSLGFGERSLRNSNELQELTGCSACGSLGDVGSDGDGGASELTDQPETFIARPGSSCDIDSLRPVQRLLPDLEVPIVIDDVFDNLSPKGCGYTTFRSVLLATSH
jgi:hypothetical protein